MSPRSKQLLLITLFIASVLVIAGMLYFFFFGSFFSAEPAAPDAETPSGAVTVPGELPSSGGFTGGIVIPGEGGTLEPADDIAQGGVTEVAQISEEEVSHLTLSGDGQSVRFLNPSDGRFYTVNAKGELVRLSEQRFSGADKVSWNRSGSSAAIEFPDGTNIVYNFETQSQYSLPAHWEDFAFSPGDDDLYAKSLAIDPDNRWLVVTNEEGTNIRAFQELGENADKVTLAPSANNQIIGFADTADPIPGSIDRRMILPIGENGENFRGLIVEGLDFIPNWAPNGKKLLYSTVGEIGGNRPLLWTVDGSAANIGDNRRSLGINTYADKCTYATSTILYCAVPSVFPQNYGLQRSLLDDTPDHLYRVDLSTGRSNLVAMPANQARMEDLQVTSDESAVYYTNGSTGVLESIKLR